MMGLYALAALLYIYAILDGNYSGFLAPRLLTACGSSQIFRRGCGLCRRRRPARSAEELDSILKRRNQLEDSNEHSIG